MLGGVIQNRDSTRIALSTEAAMRLLTPLLLFALPLWAAPAPFLTRKLTPAEADLKALQGEWVLFSCQVDEKPVKIRSGESWVFKGDRIWLYISEELCLWLRVTLTPAKSPRVINLVEAPSDHFLDLILDQHFEYRLDGDTLILRYSAPTAIRWGRPLGVRSHVDVFRRKRP
jgi:uncharacterized protein (TIGR03067 family)